MISPACVGYETNSTTPLSFPCWEQVWVQGFNNPGCTIGYQNCPQIYLNAIYSQGPYNPATNDLASQEFIKIYDNYIAGSLTGIPHNITIPNLPGYNVMQEAILNACNRLPGTCIPASQKYLNLGQNNQAYTRESISNNEGLLNFYGCVSPALTEPTSAANNLQNNKQCDPLCNRINTIKLYNQGNLLECENSVCIIDQVTINAVNSSAGGINFAQVCSNCQNGCTCIISGVNINDLWANIPDANFAQDCGENSLCYQTDSLGRLVPVNCSSTITNNNDPPNPNIPYYFYVIGAGVLILIILIALALYYK